MSEQINLDELGYDQLKAKAHEVVGDTASKIIPKMCYKLKEENKDMSNEDVGSTVKQDLVDIWSRTTIYKHMPEEFKPRAKEEDQKQVVTQTATGQQEVEKPETVSKTRYDDVKNKLDEKLQELKNAKEKAKQDLDAKRHEIEEARKKAKEATQAANQKLVEVQKNAIAENKKLQEEIERLKQAEDLEKTARELEQPEQEPEQGKNGKARYFEFDFNNKPLARDIMRFIREAKKYAKGAIVCKVIGQEVVAIMTIEEKNAEIEKLAS